MEAFGFQWFRDLVKVGLRGMIDPVAMIVVSCLDLVFFQLPPHTFFEKASDIFTFRERHMRTFVPSKSVTYLRKNVTVRMRLCLKDKTIFMPKMIGRG